MIITKIEVQKNNKNRVNLFVDDEFFCGLSVEAIIKNRIKEKDELSISQLEYFKNETEKESAFNKAIKYLSKTAKTKKQISDYLIKKGFDENTIIYVLGKLSEYKFVDDDAYTKSFIKFKTKSNGKRKIFVDLKRNGIDEEMARQHIEEDCHDAENIKYVAEKYLKNKEFDLKTKQKTFRFLMSKGYEIDDVNSCLNKIFKGEDY